ncbi:MAG: hypothetical protein ACXU8U_06175 [Asticcacaulis sp.]
MRAIFAKFVTAVMGAGLLMTATTALACNTGCPPPAPPERPTPPSPPSMPCNSCNGHHGGGGNDTNVNVNVKTSASASASAFSFGGASGAVYGGGYGNWSQTPGTPQNAGGLMVETGESALESYAERQTLTRTMVIQANCIDDTGVPHPASQLSPEREIATSYMGEVYRCIAGTHMQVTLADMGDCFGASGLASGAAVSERTSYSRSESRSASHESYGEDSYGSEGGYSEERGGMRHEEHMSGGSMHDEHMMANERAMGADRGRCMADFSHVNFDGGKTMTCQKGDALWFDHGALTCKVQIPQRQCNERSLLRRFGAGIKVLTVTRTETVTRQRQVNRESARSGMTVMTFDGGVGGFVE